MRGTLPEYSSKTPSSFISPGKYKILGPLPLRLKHYRKTLYPNFIITPFRVRYHGLKAGGITSAYRLIPISVSEEGHIDKPRGNCPKRYTTLANQTVRGN